MIKTIGIVCPECGRVNAYNTDKERLTDVDVPWLQCVYCHRKSNTDEWTESKDRMFYKIIDSLYLAHEYLCHAYNDIQKVNGNLKDVEADRYLFHLEMINKKMSNLVDIVESKSKKESDKNVKRAWIDNGNETYNMNFVVEDRNYKVGEVIEDNWGVKYEVQFDDPVATRVKMLEE